MAPARMICDDTGRGGDARSNFRAALPGPPLDPSVEEFDGRFAAFRFHFVLGQHFNHVSSFRLVRWRRSVRCLPVDPGAVGVGVGKQLTAIAHQRKRMLGCTGRLLRSG